MKNHCNKIILSQKTDFLYSLGKNFEIVSKIEGKRILEIFGSGKSFKKHCDEIISLVKKEVEVLYWRKIVYQIESKLLY